MKSETKWYFVYYKGKKWEQKHQFCSDSKIAIDKCDELNGNCITEIGNFSPKYFREQNKAFLSLT